MMTIVLSLFTMFLYLAGWNHIAVAKFGWGPADIILDFGIDLEPGDRQILVEASDIGRPFDVDIVWRLHPEHCLIQTRVDTNGNGQVSWQTIRDDQLFNGNLSHAKVMNILGLAITAHKGQACHMNPNLDEFFVSSEIKDPKGMRTTPSDSAPLGALVTIFRATSFFTPHTVTIHAGERVVWVYADGAKEPHTVTSGACREADCTGGGKLFDSGKTLNKPGHRFEHVFTHPGTFPYHCDLHNASMTGTVIVTNQ